MLINENLIRYSKPHLSGLVAIINYGLIFQGMIMTKFFLACLLAVLQITAAFAADKTIFLTSEEAPPFSSEKLKNQGISIEIIKKSFEQVGYSARIEFYSWNRALEMAKKGVSDGIAPIWYTKERTEWFLYSEKLHTPSLIGCFKQKSKPVSIKGYDDLRNYAFGYIFGYAYSQEFFDILSLANGYHFYDSDELILALVKGNIDLAILEKSQAEYILNAKFPETVADYHFIEPSLEIRNHYLVISKKAKDYQEKLADFNTGLEIILNNGVLEEILTRHEVRD